MGEQGTMYRLVIDRGDTLDGYLRVYDGAKANGLKDLSDHTAKMQIRAEADGPLILDLFVEVGTFTPTDSTTGLPVECNVHFGATAAQTKALSSWGLGVFDIEIADSFGRPWTIVRGYAELREDVTR